MAEVVEQEDETCNFLKNPLSLSDLIDTGTKFEINADFEDDFVSDIYDEINAGSDNEDNEFDQKAIISPWQKSFAELRLHMKKIDTDIYKRIVRKGTDLKDEGTVPNNARVCIRYNAYWEHQDAPFDSSFMRGSTFSFYTGRQAVLEGLEKAVCTMIKGEEAQFLISYKLLFHEMGCPPRVKPKADGLFIIELISFNLVGDINAADNLSAEDRNKFSIVIDRVKEIHLKGLDFFGQELYRNACTAFEKAVSALNYCHLANEEEQNEQTAFLIKLHTNLAVCYLKINLPKRACIMCRELRRLTNNKPSCKAIFLEGKALSVLGEYSRARSLLLTAQKMEPQNEKITKELKILEERYNRYKEDEKTLWTRAMGVIEKNSKDSNEKNDKSSEFETEICSLLQSLKDQPDFKTFTLPPGLTTKEIAVVDEVAKQMELKLRISPHDPSVYTLNKQ